MFKSTQYLHFALNSYMNNGAISYFHVILIFQHNLKFIGCLINIMTIITNRLESVKGTGNEHNLMTPSKQNTPSKQRTPSKGDQMGNNLGNSKSLVIILLRILHSLSIAGNVEVSIILWFSCVVLRETLGSEHEL